MHGVGQWIRSAVIRWTTALRHRRRQMSNLAETKDILRRFGDIRTVDMAVITIEQA